MTDLAPATVRAAVDTLTAGGYFHFTRRNLFYELVRRGAVPDPGADPSGAMAAFVRDLAAFEDAQGPMPALIRPEATPPAVDFPRDVFDYAVRRVLVFERVDACLQFIVNGFHRRIEVGLVAHPGFPAHVWDRLDAQVEDGLRTTFHAVHDCSPQGYVWLQGLRREVGSRPNARVRNVGLTYPWAFRLRLPVRSGAHPPEGLPADAGGDWRPLFERGSYAELEELTPVAAMRWVYRRIAHAAEDVGFG